MKKQSYFLLILTLLAFGTSSSFAQHDTTNSKFGKGIRIFAKDSTFFMKFSTRFQSRYEGTMIQNDTMVDPYTDRMYLRRARLKFDGWAHDPSIVYKVEIDVVNAEVIDAVVKWNFAGNFNVWFGQTKLPGNRERVISSQNLQLVDRSLLNSKFTLDRDKGIQLRHHFKVGNVLIREIGAISQGEGKNFTSSGKSYGFTGRLEVLPFGKFASKGDYVGGDLKREEKPKLALAVTYDLNDDAERLRGQIGDLASETRDLSSVQADMMFKYKGFSLMGEYAQREVTDGSPVLESGQAFYTGTSLNAQMGYLLKNNWEFATRYTIVTPEEEIGEGEITEMSFGISRYIVGHSLKIQSDVRYRQEESLVEGVDIDDELFFRFQVEVAF